MEKFKVLKSGGVWTTAMVLIPAIALFYGIMYFLNSPAIAHAAGSVRHIKIVSGKTTRSQIFKELGLPSNDVIGSKNMVYDIGGNAGNVRLIINFVEPYKSPKSLRDKVAGLAWCAGTETGSSCLRFSSYQGEITEN